MSLADISVVLAESKAGARSGMRDALRHMGFHDVKIENTLVSLREMIETKVRFDLLIVDVNLQDGDTLELVRSLRHLTAGQDPFVPVIALTWTPTLELVRRAVDAGADHLLAMPVAMEELRHRVHALIHERKPFVVTASYIGPDRRKELRPGENSAPTLPAPNILKGKMDGRMSRREIQETIDAAVRALNETRIERDIAQVEWLLARIMPLYLHHKFTPELAGHLEELHFSGQDMAFRLQGSRFEAISELCRSLCLVTQSLQKRFDHPASKDVALLAPLGQAMRQAYVALDSTAPAAHRIAEIIAKTRL